MFAKVLENLPNPTNKVCFLKKSLYGLKQASRQWFAKLVHGLGMSNQIKNDHSLFSKHKDGFITFATFYVDDIILTCNDLYSIYHLKSHLHVVLA